jgi:poly(beta-D-mannuronate) C5 epimerase
MALAIAVTFLLLAASCGDGGDGKVPPALPPATMPDPPPLPSIAAAECTIDTALRGIYTDGTHAVETTDGINAALADASASGCGRAQLPAGTYLIGKELDPYTLTGIKMPGGMALVLDPAALIRVVPNDNPYYCAIDIDGVSNVEVSGGEIEGDRATHSFENPDVTGSSTHEFGYLVCIRGGYSPLNSDVVYIHDIRLHGATGDGVCIEAHGEGGSNTGITIRGCEIFDNRRQGISIVGGSDVLIENNEIHSIGGTAPQFGIDIESENHRSANVVVRGNRFHDNKGGDFVACDGENVWFLENTCDQGADNWQTDGPVVYWKKAQVTIRGNTITMDAGSSNGKLGIIEYDISERPIGVPTVIDGNTLNGCGIMATDDVHVIISGNQVGDYFIWMENLTGLVLTGNSIETTGGLGFVFRNVRGEAGGNMLNGAPVEFPLTDDEPFSN